MRKQFLYVNKAGFHYWAPGNISIAQGSKGSVFFWYHPMPDLPASQTIWQAYGDSGNFMRLGIVGVGTLGLGVSTSQGGRTVIWPDFFYTQRNYWMPITCTWDFTVAGQGKLRLYVNGEEAPDRADDCVAPQVEATKLFLGPGASEGVDALDGCLDNFAVWDDVMTKAQHDALWGGAANWTQRLMQRRRLPRQADGEGTLTFLATFDGSYDAQVAGGDATAQWEVGEGSYDQFCRLDDGSRGRGVRQQFFFGQPRHDDTPDDRVPIGAVLAPLTWMGAGAYTTLTNKTNYSQINISQVTGGPDLGQGVGWLREWLAPYNMALPATIKMRVNCPDAGNPVGTQINLGPLCYTTGGEHGNNFGTWGTGEVFQVVDDVGNTASSFKTNLPARPDGYWTGAEVSFRSGTDANCRLKVANYTGASGLLTLSGALPTTPAAGDKGLVDFRGRICPTTNPLDETQNMEAWLWEEYSTDKPWIELECVYANEGGTAFTRYQRGRTTLMNLTNIRSDVFGRYLMFGRSQERPYPSSYQCEIRLESLTIEGPGQYQVLSPKSSPQGRGFELADTFLLQDADTGMSSRVWRQGNVTRQLATPSVDADPEGVQADLQALGTWRQSAFLSGAIDPQERLDRVTALLGGSDANGNWGAGYIQGQWDAARRRITWVDETPPEGKSNPFFTYADFIPWITRDEPWGLGKRGGLRVLGLPDGTWTMLIYGTQANPDHYWTRALHGAEDRWSFSWEDHWWPENPILPGFGGVDKLAPDHGATALFGNRDAEWIVAHNPYAQRPERRFVAYGRFKTIMPLGDTIAANRRPLAGWVSGDLRTFFLLPHGASLSPLGAGEVYSVYPRAVSDDFMQLYVTSFGDQIRLWASDDDRHYQAVHGAYITGSGVRCAFALEDKTVLYYTVNGKLNLAHLQRDRETYYGLSTGQTQGYLETAILIRPQDGWKHLMLNAEGNAGTLQVEVLDPRTDEPYAGFAAADCDSVGSGIEQRVTWNGTSLKEMTAEAIRLRFVLARSTSSDTSPTLYAWRVTAAVNATAPQVSDLRVEGRVNPMGVSDPTPSFSWTYTAAEAEQAAYQLLVASTLDQLEANEGDIWDSGPIESAAAEAEYGGPALGEETTYFWKVRVRDSEGVWSEEW